MRRKSNLSPETMEALNGAANAAAEQEESAAVQTEEAAAPAAGEKDAGSIIAQPEADRAPENPKASELRLSAEQQRQLAIYEWKLEQLLRREESYLRQERARFQVNRWLTEAEELMNGDYPDFDLCAETENPTFLSLLRAGVPMRHAYEVLHRDDILRAVRLQTEAETERRVVENIRAQGLRPRENGASAQGSFLTRSDPRGLSREEHNRINERVRRGEKITF